VDVIPQSRVDDIRDEEARIVAETCARLIGNIKTRGADRSVRVLSAGDIALLAPTGRELWRYERALEEAELPFSSQAGKNFYRRQEVQDLVALVRALGDPRDIIALGALMRGPLVGLTEEELLDLAEALASRADSAGVPPRLSLRTDPALVPHPVARETLTILQDLRRRVRGTAPALLLGEAIERLRVRAILMTVWKRALETGLAGCPGRIRTHECRIENRPFEMSPEYPMNSGTDRDRRLFASRLVRKWKCTSLLHCVPGRQTSN
jgi:CRISPR-associated exonuclease Cas4